VATTGDYDDLTDKPSIPTKTSDLTNDSGFITVSDIPAQVQADWTETDTSDPAYIAHKPTLATVATTGDYSDLSNTPTIPTKTSDLTNDSGFITSSDIPAQVQSDWTESDSSDPSFIQNKPDLSIYAESANLATVATTGDYDDLIDKPTIPTKTSDLTNDSGFITSSDIPAQVQSDWTESDTTDPSYIQNKPNLATVATTGSYSDLSNKPSIPTKTSDLTNDSGFITSSDIPAQVQADWTESDSSDPSYIQNKPTLATVATTGSYADLSNKPSIPTKTSDLTNDSGFITISDVPAQVQSDWTESDSSDPAYIANKPTLATVATSGDYGDLLNKPTINNVPAVTSSDNDKVLKATYSGGVGSYSWEVEQGTTYSAGDGVSIDQNNVISANVDGSTITTNSSGELTANIPSQVQSDWTESDTTDPSYIQNKPTEKTLAAGSNVTITEANDTVTISSTDTTYTAGTGIDITSGVVSIDTSVVATQADLATKQDTLTAGTNVSISNNVISATDTTYTAGTGIDITNNEISVETPVDIVAGPGIVIDNPDGNTLRVSTDSAYETVLWSGSPTNSVTLSETMNNFEFIDVYERWDNDNANAIVHRIYMEGKTTAVLNFAIGGNAWYLVVQKLALNGTSLSVNSAHSIHGSSYTSTDIIHESNTTLLKNTIVKVVGVHRIANN
jgi:hypothetical protein